MRETQIRAIWDRPLLDQKRRKDSNRCRCSPFSRTLCRWICARSTSRSQSWWSRTSHFVRSVSRSNLHSKSSVWIRCLIRSKPWQMSISWAWPIEICKNTRVRSRKSLDRCSAWTTLRSCSGTLRTILSSASKCQPSTWRFWHHWWRLCWTNSTSCSFKGNKNSKIKFSKSFETNKRTSKTIWRSSCHSSITGSSRSTSSYSRPLIWLSSAVPKNS